MDATNIELLISKGEETAVRRWTVTCEDWREQRFSETRDSPLHVAVRAGQERLVKVMLELRHLPTVCNALNETPLMVACDSGDLGICKFLCTYPEALTQTDLLGGSAIHHAAASGSAACLGLLLQNGASVHAADNNGDTPLHVAAHFGKCEAVTLLLDNGADIEAKNHEAERPLHKAAAASDSYALEILIARGAGINTETTSKRTAIGIAIRSGNLPIVEALVRGGVVVSKNHLKLAKEASRIAVWRYLQTVSKKQLPNVSSGEDSPMLPKPPDSQEDTRLKELMEERNLLAREVATLKQQLATVLLPTIIDFSELTLGELIGRGSFGEVYRARWRGTEVAVKRLLSAELEGEFKAEAMILQRLRHPNVILAMGMCLSPPSLIVEYVPQGSLLALIHRSKCSLSLPLLRSMALDIARAMNYLHNCNPPVLHRDLNPANCLVTADFHIKICDFGLAKLKTAATQGTNSLGTVQYSAPEFISEQRFSAKSDVYSFGVLLWEMMTRQVPFSGLQPVQVVYAVINYAKRPALPADTPLKSLIERCWSQEEGCRLDFSEVIEELESAEDR